MSTKEIPRSYVVEDAISKSIARGLIAVLIGRRGAARATQYPLTSGDALMFGDMETITAFGEDTLPDLARRYSLGYEEIQRANPGVDLWLPGEGTADR